MLAEHEIEPALPAPHCAVLQPAQAPESCDMVARLGLLPQQSMLCRAGHRSICIDDGLSPHINYVLNTDGQQTFGLPGAVRGVVRERALPCCLEEGPGGPRLPQAPHAQGGVEQQQVHLCTAPQPCIRAQKTGFGVRWSLAEPEQLVTQLRLARAVS